MPDHVFLRQSLGADGWFELTWPVVDLATQLSGNVSVPLYPGQDVDSARYILEHGDSKLVFLGDFDQHRKSAEILIRGIPTVAMRGCEVACYHVMEELVQFHQPYSSSPVSDVDSLLTIVYSSGATGKPKGVMLTYGNPAPGTMWLEKWLDIAGADFTGERGRIPWATSFARYSQRYFLRFQGCGQNSKRAWTLWYRWRRRLRSVKIKGALHYQRRCSGG
ncbi:MAG: acyl-CoA synthetase (AMP-forming)/AMP-acid ligase II [Cryomorphaceae bacterium]